MKKITKKMMKQRGCEYCAHPPVKVADNEAQTETMIKICPFDEYPYHELDGIKDYIRDYDKVVKNKWKLALLKGAT